MLQQSTDTPAKLACYVTVDTWYHTHLSANNIVHQAWTQSLRRRLHFSETKKKTQQRGGVSRLTYFYILDAKLDVEL